MLNIDKLRLVYYTILEDEFIDMIKSIYLTSDGWCPKRFINCKYIDDINGNTLYKLFYGEIELEKYNKSYKKHYQLLVHKYISKDLILL